MSKDLGRQWSQTGKHATAGDHDVAPISQRTESAFAKDGPSGLEVFETTRHGQIAILAANLVVEGHQVVTVSISGLVNLASMDFLDTIGVLAEDVNESNDRIAETIVCAICGEKTAESLLIFKRWLDGRREVDARGIGEGVETLEEGLSFGSLSHGCRRG